MASILEVYQIAKDIINSWNKRLKKIPLGSFEKMIELKAKTKLSKQSKQDLVQELIDSGEIRQVTSTNGKKYILIGDII